MIRPDKGDMMFYKAVSGLLVFVLFFTGSRSTLAASDYLDPTFGESGRITTDFQGSNDHGAAAILQPDGKIILAGSSFIGADDDFALARYLPDGSLDASFGVEGKVTTDISNSYLLNINMATATDLESLPGIGPTTAQWIVDYRETHGPFGDITAIQLVPGIGPMTFSRIKDLITVGTDTGYAVTLQPDGKILVGGESTRNISLVRYNTDGSLDTTFDMDGKVMTNLGDNDYIFNIAIQNDHRIVVSGRSGWNLVLVRYHSDGSLDTSFDGDGIRTLDFGSGENYGGYLALQPDGRIILAGQTFILYVGYVFALARFNPDGSLDPSFGTDGTVTTSLDNSFDDGIAAVLVQPNGQILVTGTSEFLQTPNWVFALARYNPDGSLDTSFGNQGTIMTDLGITQDTGNAIDLQSDGGIVVAGRTGTTYNSGDNDFALVRYTREGFLDSSFGADGIIITDFGYGADFANSVFIQPDGKIVAVGSAFNGTDDDFALARYDVASVIEVNIDIKPGNRANVINARSSGTIPVAILSSTEFDAPSMVDRNSLTFGRSGDEPSLAFCNKTDVDLNRDGLPDLLCHFRISLTGFQAGDTIAILHGATLNNMQLAGQDKIRVLK